MSRRKFVREALAVGAVSSVSPAWSAGASRAMRPNSKRNAGLDLQQSTLVVNGLDPSTLNDNYLRMLQSGGVNCWHQSVGSSFARFASLLNFFDEHRGQIAPAGSVSDIHQLRRENIISHISGWQSADALIVNANPAPKSLRAYHELGLRICGIAYNVANDFGGGCLDPQVGLTRAGHRLIEEIHRSQIVLDVGGHTNELTSFDALAISSDIPVICSHTNIKALNNNPRCSTDRFLEAVAKSGGVIGLTAFNDFHARRESDAPVLRTPQVSLDRHLDQYDYLKRLVGVDHIGIGPDFIEGRNPPGRLGEEDRYLMPPEIYSQELPWYYVAGFENIGELPNVTQGLLERGWSDSEVRKVLGENWLRVYEQVWGK